MVCHRTVANDQPAIHALASIHPKQRITPVTPVYQVPGFVFFRHQQHTGKGVSCAACHGDVWQQDRMQPFRPMKMSTCIDCHRQSKATVSCTACHELSQ
jgi:formate-dependent nitrite reductase cytochrome c552 subunit